MTAFVGTLDAFGNNLAMTHREVRTGKPFRILAVGAKHAILGDAFYLLVDEEGIAYVIHDYQFNTPGAFVYIPGGQ